MKHSNDTIKVLFRDVVYTFIDAALQILDFILV